MNVATGDQQRDNINHNRSRLVVNGMLASLPSAVTQRALLPLSFREIGHGYRTGWSFAYSVVLHHLVLFLIVFSTHHTFLTPLKIISPQLDKAIPVDTALYLPLLGGGSEGTGKQG